MFHDQTNFSLISAYMWCILHFESGSMASWGMAWISRMLNFQLSISHKLTARATISNWTLTVGYPVILSSKISVQLFGLLICCSIRIKSFQICSGAVWFEWLWCVKLRLRKELNISIYLQFPKSPSFSANNSASWRYKAQLNFSCET